MITANKGYTLAATGKPNQAVTFSVDASYYNADDVLFVENFEGASEGDTGDGQKFHGVYGGKASGEYTAGKPVAMPVVTDPAKARTGEKSITQAAYGAQAEGVYAEYKGDELPEGAVATMWYYDDGSNATGSQWAFMGGVITKGWTQGQFNGTVGSAKQPNGTVEGEYASRGKGGTWKTTGVKASEGWHKFQWKIGASETEMFVDDEPIPNTGAATTTDFGGFHITFNWNNWAAPVKDKHYIDSFSIVKPDAAADQTFTKEVTVYVISDEDQLKGKYEKTDDTTGRFELINEIGAVIDTCEITAPADVADKLKLTVGEGADIGMAEIKALTGWLLADDNNPLAKETAYDVKVTYHFGGDDAGTETFETTFDVLYDVDEGNTGDVDLTGSGERTTIDLNGKWQFGGKGLADASAMDFDDSGWDTVTVPHDWNAKTGDGVNARENGTFWYRRTLELTAEEAEKYNERSAFLEFYSVGMDSHVYLNGAEVGAHKGGWSAFKIDVTGKFQEGENVIAVSANNERKLNGDIAPLHGDFDNASGMNRDVKLVLTSQVHIDQLDHGSHGVYMVPQRADGWSESNDIWDVDVTARIANDTIKSRDVTVKATISHPTEFDDVLGMEEKGLLRFDPEDMYDPNGTAVGEETVTISAIRESATEAALSVRVEDPELWNGVESPYRYVAKIEVFDGNEADPDKLVDSYETMIGFRYYDAVRTDEGGYGMNDEDGFYLNGKPYLLRGMAFHEDWPGFGRALSKEFIAKDVEVLYEMGATWTRVSHYPHDEYCYELLSQYGIACSAEIPLVDGVSLVNPDGSYTDSKKEGILSPSFKETTLDLFRDMVKQNYNQPAILGWLMQNELGGGTYGQGSGADAKAAQSEMITALHNLSHELDPGRKTVMAMSLPHCYEYDADWLLWNSYPGWYDGNTTGIGYFIDA